MKPIQGNCISKEDIRQRIVDVLDYVDNTICKTLGPCGHNVLIQQADKVIMTKDGWTVAQHIHMNNIIDNSIKSLIESCCQSVVLKAGDGTTTVTKAANVLNKDLLSYTKENQVKSIRVLQENLELAVKNIANRLRENSTKITDDNLYSSIKQVALVSTNWDETVSDMIASIYEKTHNTIIKVEESGTEETTYRIVDGYELAGDLMIPDFNMTDKKLGVCEIDNPYIMIFDFKLQDKYFIPLYALANILQTNGRKLVVMAPDFEKSFLNRLNSAHINSVKQGDTLNTFIPVTVITNYNIDRDCLSDFGLLTGALTITKQNDDIDDFLDDVTKCAGLAKNVEPLTSEEKTSILQGVVPFMENICGTCEIFTAKERHLVARGLSNRESDVIKERIEKLQYEIDKKLKECDALTILTDDIRQKRIRLAKLKGNTGVISVGGHGATDLRARKDALDDAIRACEEAYNNGYNTGSSLAIIKATYEELNNPTVNDKLYIDIVNLFRYAFCEVFNTLFFNNGNYTNEEIVEIREKCIEYNIGFDILIGNYDTENKVINPTSVDIEVLTGCLRLALVCNTSDQFLFSSPDAFDFIYGENGNVENSRDVEVVTNQIIASVNKG